jgi:hypothetical protein
MYRPGKMFPSSFGTNLGSDSMDRSMGSSFLRALTVPTLIIESSEAHISESAVYFIKAFNICYFGKKKSDRNEKEREKERGEAKGNLRLLCAYKYICLFGIFLFSFH